MTERLRRYSSNATETTPASGITNVSTAVTPTNPSGYPSAPFTIQIDNEAILVSEVDGGTFKSLTRGFDGTTAVAHSTTATLKHVAIGDDFDNRWLDRVVTRPHGTYDDEFGGASIGTQWTEQTVSGTATWAQDNVLSVAFDSQTADDVSCQLRSIPVFPPYDFTTAVRLGGYADDDAMAGILLTDGTTTGSNAITCGFYYDTSTARVIAQQKSGTLTALSTNEGSQSMHFMGPWMYLRLRWAAINLFRCYWSPDGVSWVNFDFSDIFQTFTPTHAGVWCSSNGSAESKIATFEYFRAEQVI
jgi:hypothetical protein